MKAIKLASFCMKIFLVLFIFILLILMLSDDENSRLPTRFKALLWLILFALVSCLEFPLYEISSMLNFSWNRGVFCPIVGCGSHLKSLENFEDHYTARHTASCSVCPRVYPTQRLLSIHVSEAHDSFFQAKVARGFAMVFPVMIVL